MNLDMRPTFHFDVTANELVLILKALKRQDRVEYHDLLDKISRARLQQVENYAKQLALSLPTDED